MKPDDIKLSGYLDDELAPDAREAVEQALTTDPTLAHRLRQLAQTRDLVAGLSRPKAPVSLAGSVMSRVEADQTVPRRSPLFWIATAASLLFAIILTIRAREHTPRQNLVNATTPDNALTQAPPVNNSIAPAVPAQPVAIAQAKPAPPPLEVTKPAAIVHPEEDPAIEAGRVQLASMIERPGRVRRILIVTDVLDSAARQRVHDLLKDTPRKDPEFSRFTVAQGLLIDPTHPNEAEVFATVMDSPEEGFFIDRARKLMPGIVEEADLSPGAELQLAEAGPIRFDSGKQAAGLTQRNDQQINALRKEDHPDGSPLIVTHEVPKAATKPVGASTVLVWLTSRMNSETIP
jgi:hypothetical protein